MSEEEVSLKPPTRAYTYLDDTPKLWILLQHNLTFLIVSDVVSVIVGCCMQQLLVSFVFFAMWRKPLYIKDPSLVHQDQFRMLRSGYQLLAYGGIWCLLVACDVTFSLVTTARLTRATGNLARSMFKDLVKQHQKEITPYTGFTFDNKRQEWEVSLQLDIEDTSLLNSIREKISSAVVPETEKNQELGKHEIHVSSADLIHLSEGPKLTIGPEFLKYISWQVVSDALIGASAWAIPDVVIASRMCLDEVAGVPYLRTYSQYILPFVLVFSNLTIASIVILVINRLLVFQQDRKLQHDRFLEPPKPNSTAQSIDSDSTQKGKRFSETSFLVKEIYKPGKEYAVNPLWKIISAKVLLSLGFSVGISLEMFIDGSAEHFVSGSYMLEALTSFITVLTAAYIQWSYLDTSSTPKITRNFKVIIKRFLSVSLSLLSAWSIKYVVSDTKEILVSLFTPLSTVDTNRVFHLNMFRTVGHSNLVTLTAVGELVVAVLCTLFFGIVVTLITMWQNNAVDQAQGRYHRHFLKLVCLSFGTVIGWSWSVFTGVLYEEKIANRIVKAPLWVAAISLSCFVFLVVQLCCIVSMVLVFKEEQAKYAWRHALQAKRRVERIKTIPSERIDDLHHYQSLLKRAPKVADRDTYRTVITIRVDLFDSSLGDIADSCVPSDTPEF